MTMQFDKKGEGWLHLTKRKRPNDTHPSGVKMRRPACQSSPFFDESGNMPFVFGHLALCAVEGMEAPGGHQES